MSDTVTQEFDPPSGPNGIRENDEQLARFATDGWVDGVAAVPIAEVSTMVAEDPTVVSALIGALRYARARHQAALELAARISQETPLPDEMAGWTDQRAKMIATIGTLRARIDELTRPEWELAARRVQPEWAAAGKDADEDRGKDDGLFICGRSLDEDFTVGETYGTRQEAINAFAEEYGAYGADGTHFQTARLKYTREIPDFPYDGDEIVDQVSGWWESAVENFVDKAIGPHTKELEAALERVWTSWCQHHDLEFRGYLAEDLESHTVGEDEDEATLAERKKERAAEEPPP